MKDLCAKSEMQSIAVFLFLITDTNEHRSLFIESMFTSHFCLLGNVMIDVVFSYLAIFRNCREFSHSTIAFGMLYWFHLECDNCIHLLMDDIEFLDRNVTTMRRELDSISVGILAFQRLEKINRTVAELRPQVDDLANRPTDPSQLDPIKRELHRVQSSANEVSMKVLLFALSIS